MLSDAGLSARIDEAAEKGLVVIPATKEDQVMVPKLRQTGARRNVDEASKGSWEKASLPAAQAIPAHVVGIIIGSPEFQRR